MTQASGSWKTTSSLLDDFDFSIEEAWFGTNEKFGDSVLLNLRGIAEQEVEGEDVVVDDEHTILLSTGDGWEATKGGREASHSAGKTTFQNNSNLGRWIDACVALGDEALEELAGRGETYEADTWEGLKLHIERQQFGFTNREGERIEFEVPLPTEYLGTFEPGEEEKPKPKKKSSGRKKKGSSRGRKKKADNSELREAVVEFAAEFEDDAHADFVEEVFDPEEFDQAEELQNDEELSADVLDEDGEIWTEAHE